MKKLFYLVPLLLAALFTMGSGLQRGLTVDRYKDLTRDHSQARPLLTSAKPKWAVRWDDNRDNTRQQILEFARQGIPVTLVINYSNIDQSGFLTTANIQNIIAFFDSVGVDLEVANHGNTNFQGNTPFSMGYQQLVEEFDRSDLEALTGRSVTAFLAPGDSRNRTFYRKNKAVIKAVLDSLGYEYAMMGYGGPDSTGVAFQWHLGSGIWNATVDADRQDFLAYPGIAQDPFWIPSSGTMDLGSSVVERDGSETSNVSDWDIVGQAVGDKDDFKTTFRWRYMLALANGAGMMLAMHDSVDTDAATLPAGLTGTSAGHFSPVHVAWVCKQLKDAGYVDFVTASEYFDWLLSDYAPGTDLVWDKSMDIPMYAIGDSSGIEYPWAIGCGSFGAERAAFPTAGTQFGTGNWDLGLNGKYDRTGDFPTASTGSSIAGWGGRGGGHALTATQNRFNFGRVSLPPGRYEVGFIQNTDRFEVRYMHMAHRAIISQFAPRQFGGSAAYNDTLKVHRWITLTNNALPALSLADALWRSISYGFEISSGGDTGDFFAKAAEMTLYTDPVWLQQSWTGGFFWQIGSVDNPTISHPYLIYWGRPMQ